mmetsp:Transcript_3315/g.8929  ORF Transcript_3315/g.8929 Transcript_3315/m.8929 type:complete len:200 (+) Transcript_3315:1258-1857(+)
MSKAARRHLSCDDDIVDADVDVGSASLLLRFRLLHRVTSPLSSLSSSNRIFCPAYSFAFSSPAPLSPPPRPSPPLPAPRPRACAAVFAASFSWSSSVKPLLLLFFGRFSPSRFSDNRPANAKMRSPHQPVGGPFTSSCSCSSLSSSSISSSSSSSPLVLASSCDSDLLASPSSLCSAFPTRMARAACSNAFSHHLSFQS